MASNIVERYFFILFSILPISIVVGPLVSLANILIIDISFLIYAFYHKEWRWLKDKRIKLLLLLYIYLILNSFTSIEFSNSFPRNFGFVRFIIFFAAFNYFFIKYENFHKFFILWFVVLLIVIFDINFEAINGSNILGYGYNDRIYSFFNKPIAASYILAFFILIIAYLFQYFNKKNYLKYIILIFSIICLASIFLTGERSNTIKALMFFGIFYLFNDNFSFKEKFTSLILISLFFTMIFLNSNFLKMRYVGQLYNQISAHGIKGYYHNNNYFNIYRSGIEVFKKYPYFGVGNKNYRVASCLVDSPLECNTHPHQIYVELLAEHGLFGFILLLSILFYLIFKNLKTILLSRNMLQIGAFSYLLINFIPILPGGSFFSDFNSTLFWLNFSIFYASNPKTNIFNKIMK